MPNSVTVGAGLASATFTGTASNVTTNQAVTVTATYSGGSVATTVTVQAPAVQLSSLSCTPTTVTTPGTANCTVTLSAAATAATTIALASSSGSVSVPASVSVGSGGTSAAFTANASSVSSQTTVQVTAGYNGISKAVNLTLQPPAAPTVSSLHCAPNPVTGGSAAQCTVTLSAPAPSGGQLLQVSDNSRRVSVPSSVTAPGGSASVSFQASTSQVSQNVTVTIQAAMKSGKTITSSASYSLTISAPPALTSLACSPSTIANKQSTACTVAVASVTPVDLNVGITANWYLSVPGSVLIRAGQSAVAFTGVAQSAKNTTVTVTASLNGVSVKTPVTISSTAPAVNAPHLTTSMDREPVEFEVSASDPQDLPVTVVASTLPAGASFDTATGRFRWAPGESRHGDYPAVFTATNSMGQQAESRVWIQVRPGQPVIEHFVHGATGSVEQVCSPGALAKVVGEGLLSRRDGEETQVWVNGSPVPVIRKTDKTLLFQCPAAPAGTKLAVEVHRGAAVSNTAETVMVDAAPGIFSLDGTGRGQGLVMLTEFRRVAMVRSPGDVSQPATATDRITLQVTGLGEGASSDGMQLQVGTKRVPAESVAPVSPGVWQVTGRLPEEAGVSDAVAVQLVVERYGQVLKSNVVTIAIESRDLGVAVAKE
ncbi:MAG: putative Ig domain-containing protein [Bryobacterales bacterium]|nr:putative Ig domain-containing protein [Bryobacterales bacterium]